MEALLGQRTCETVKQRERSTEQGALQRANAIRETLGTRSREAE